MGYINKTQHKSSTRGKKTLSYKIPHRGVWGPAPEMCLNLNYHWRETIHLIVPTQEKTNFLLNYSWRTCNFLTSAVITGLQLGEMSKLDWMIGWSSRDMWSESLYFLYVLFGSICKTFASLQHILRIFCKHVGIIMTFQANHVSGYIFAP
jgi:hypothetical protein